MPTLTAAKPGVKTTPDTARPTRRQASRSSQPTVDEKPVNAAPADEAKHKATGLRSTWRGQISFGLISIPVRLFTATTHKDVRFNLLHAKCDSRIQEKKWCPVCKREVEQSELVRAYEYTKGKYVKFTDADFESIPVPSKHTISLSEFVKAEEIDPIYYEQSYYLEPETGGGKAFGLLAKAMEDKGLTAIAKITMRQKERLCALRMRDGALILATLFYNDEVRVHPMTGADSVEVSEPELQMAHMLIDHLTSKFKPNKYQDEYRKALENMIAAKVEGRQTVKPTETAQPDNVIDLMAALKASIAQAGKTQPDSDAQPKERASKRPARKAA